MSFCALIIRKVGQKACLRQPHEKQWRTSIVNISAATLNLIKDEFNYIYRGKITSKNIGEIDMYFVERKSVLKINLDEPETISATYLLS